MTALCTIGFAGKDLEDFVTLLRGAGVARLLDVRLRPDGHLSGYARQRNLRFVLERYEGIAYEHRPELAPTSEILDGYRADGDWERYERRFGALLDERDWIGALDASIAGEGSVALLCSEAAPERCHRRLVAETYASRRPRVEVRHLVLERASRPRGQAEAVSAR